MASFNGQMRIHVSGCQETLNHAAKSLEKYLNALFDGKRFV